MKRVNLIYKTLPLLFAAFCLGACDDDTIQDIPKVQETLSLTPSTLDVNLEEMPDLQDIAITYDWTSARQLSDDYIVSYTTKLDVVGNNFGTSTAIITSEDDGIFSKSFTGEQLQTWANEKWGLKPNKVFTLEFRVVTQWTGGPEFQSPEVRTVYVEVQPVKVFIFEADKVFLTGSATGSYSQIEMAKTLENENQYAHIIDLVPGELRFPVLNGEETTYICPTDGEGTLQDGLAENVLMAEQPISWTIPTAGKYRIVLNMEKTTVTIYSPATDLQPKVVTWFTNVAPIVQMDTPVTELWIYGGGTGWGWWKGEMVVSLADPQILVYSGKALSSGDGVKFTVYGEADFRNVSYTFTNPLTSANLRQNLTLAIDKLGDLWGGYDGETRNSYYKLPSGANFIVLDLRNMTIIAHKK